MKISLNKDSIELSISEFLEMIGKAGDGDRTDDRPQLISPDFLHQTSAARGSRFLAMLRRLIHSRNEGGDGASAANRPATIKSAGKNPSQIDRPIPNQKRQTKKGK